MKVGTLINMLEMHPHELNVKLLIFHNELLKDRLYGLYDLATVSLLSHRGGTEEVVGITHRKRV